MALSEDQQRQTREIAWEVGDVIANRMAAEVAQSIRLHASECATAKEADAAKQAAKDAADVARQAVKDAAAITIRHADTCDVKTKLDAILNQAKGARKAAAIVAAVVSFLIGVAGFIIGLVWKK
jgi:hypothetical protein